MICEKTVKKFCREDISLIENYSEAIADKTQTWDCHHRGEILPCGRYSIAQLKKYGLYFSRPASELIFLTKATHRKLHHLGKHLSAESREKNSAAHLGNKYMLGHHHSEESRAKISAALKGNKWNFGKHWFNNGKICIRAKSCPEGFVPGRIKR